MEDAQIVKLFSERKELALEETRLKYGEYCRVIAHNILGSEEDAEECINNTAAQSEKFESYVRQNNAQYCSKQI